MSLGTFCPWDVLSLGRFVLGRFDLERFVCASHRIRILTFWYRYSRKYLLDPEGGGSGDEWYAALLDPECGGHHVLPGPRGNILHTD